MKLRTALVAMAAAALTLTACTNGGSQGDQSPSAQPSEATGTLKVWLMAGSQPESVVDAVNDEFAKTYPNVGVEVELQEWGEIKDKLTSTLGTESTPDVVEIGNTWTSEYAHAGLLADLTEPAKEMGVDQMLAGLVDSGEYDGIRYGIPYYGGVRIVVYKKSDFRAAGIAEVPRTIEELQADAEKLQARNAANHHYSAFYFPGRYWYGALPFVWMNGGEIATQQGGNWTGKLDSDESQKGLAQLNLLVQRYSKAPKDGDESANLEAFNTGNVGMMIDSWWAPGALDAKGQPFSGDVGVFALPGPNARATAPVFFGGSNLSVSAKSSQQELASDWIAILAGTQIQSQLAREAGVIPNQKAAFVAHEGNEFLKVADNASENSKFTPVSPNWGKVESAQVLPNMLVRIFTGMASISDAAKEASAAITTTLNE